MNSTPTVPPAAPSPRSPASTPPAGRSPEEQTRRTRLRRLDDCLDALERAHELDATVVSELLAELIRDRVPTILPGMLIAKAIEEVLRCQEPFMTEITGQPSRRSSRRRRRNPFDVWVLLRR